jgi:glutaminyl-tRNA synthetase
VEQDETKVAANFLRSIVAEDLAAGRHRRVVTRFPPEPNGYPHIGHAKSICVNFGLADEFGGACNLRMDDTDPTKESYEYVEAFKRDVAWLGFRWAGMYFCSDYFEQLHDHAVKLIHAGDAYVCGLTDEEIRAYRGTVTEAGRPSPGRDRSTAENLDLFARMRAGEFPDGAYTLRARIDMASPNMKMRDPLLYRIRHHAHYHRGNAWCIYPMYDWAHPISDAIEGITHSICTLEFENNRELYDWVLDHTGYTAPRPRQYEMARLAVNYTVMSKRKLLRLVNEKRVDGWDDPRMPTIAGMRRRGVTPEAIREFCDRVGVARANSVVDIAALDAAIRDDLNTRAPRMMAVLRPLKVVIESWTGGEEWIDAPLWPHDVPKEGSRKVPFTREVWIDRDDFAEEPPKGWHRLAPGKEVRLRYGYVIRCVGVEKDAAGNVVAVRATHDPETRGGTTPDGRKVAGTIHWVSVTHATRLTVRLYDRLFLHERPDAGDEDFLTHLNPRSLEVVEAMGEPALADATGHVQLERVGYFFREGDGWNRVVGLKDSFTKATPAPQPAKVAPPQAAKPREIAAEVLARFPGVNAEEAVVLDGDARLAAMYRDASEVCHNRRAVASFLVNEVPRDAAIAGAAIGRLVARIEDGTLSSRLAKDVLAELVAGEADPDAVIARKGLVQVSDDGAIAPHVDAVVAANPDKVAAFRGGKQGLLGFFVGEVMKRSGGKANPKRVQELVRAALGE